MSDNWNHEYLNYTDTVQLMKMTVIKDRVLFCKFQEFFTEVLFKFSSNPPTSGTPTSADIANLKPIPSFQIASRSTYKYIQMITSIIKQYDEKAKELCEKATDSLNSLRIAEDCREKAYQKYTEAGEKLKRAYDAKDPNLPAIQNEFLAAQKNAVDTHVHMNDVSAQTEMRMEGAISQFEDVQKWRSNELQEIVDKFVVWISELAKQFKQNNEELDKILHKIPSDSVIDQKMTLSELVAPEADIDYQILQVNPLITSYIPKDDLFKEEVSQGKKLYVVTKECEAHGRYLGAIVSEIVVALNDEGNDYYVKNINECEGLIPKSILAEYK